ncbi:MAG: penicillin-binding transpeptidase domain-containing protein, partial [Bacillota bacterium]
NQYQQVDAAVYNHNLPIWSTYEPGSTFKIITLAAAIEEGVVDLDDDHYHDNGSIQVAGQRLRCWKRGGHGDQTFLEVVENSCNPGFVVLGQRLGKDTLFKYIDAFGFGKKTGIELNGEATGILFHPSQVGPVELATTAFGQGVAVTPIQQVSVVSAIVNGGHRIEPTIIKSNKPVTLDVDTQVISEKTSKMVREALESVVSKGTGRGAYVEGYRVGGKTGTAQKVGENGRYMANNHIVSFIGVAPMQAPEIVVYVAIDNPKNTVQFGGVVAAPIVGRIIEDVLTLQGVEKTKGLDKEVDWPEQRFIEVPDYTGENIAHILTQYELFTLDISGEGEVVLDQRPKPGERVREGSVIELFLTSDN